MSDFNGVVARPPLRRVAAGARPHAPALLLGSIAALVVAAASSAAPALVGLVMDRGVVDRDPSVVLLGGAGFLGVSAVQLGGQWIQAHAMGRFAHRYMNDLRMVLLRHLYRLDLEFFGRVPTGRVVSRLTSDVDNLQQFVEHGLALVLRTVLLLVIMVGVMVSTSVPMTAVVVALLVPLGVASLWFRRVAYQAQVDVRDRMADMLGHVNESLTGSRVIQAYTYEDVRRETFRRVNDDTHAARVQTVRVNAAFYTFVEFLSPAAVATVVGLGAWMASRGTLTVGTVVAFTMYLGRLFEPIQQLTELAQILQQASASYGKVFQFLDLSPKVQDAPDALPVVAGDGRIELEGVSYRYADDGPDVVVDVTLHVSPCTRLALVGHSGAGKTTLARLIARFHDVTSGRVLVDGQDVRSVQAVTLRRHVAMVTQEGYLFDGTILENIAMGSPGATRDEVEAACERLGILERLASLPQGLDTPVGNRGLSLSSGQRQLIALARALVAEPRIVILDEATSNLDPETDELVEGALARLLDGRTTVVIAHRVETAMRADRIVLMEDGRIVEDGTPTQLLVSAGTFARWARAVREVTGSR